MKNSFNFLIALLKALLTQFLGFRVNFRQLVQLELYASKIDYVLFFINQIDINYITKALELEQRICSTN